jgi:serine/threonine-protein kinase
MVNVGRIVARDRKGQIIGGRYQLLSLLDRGGQGSVYRARDLKDLDEVAIKVLADSMATDPQYRERMFREAHAMTTLRGTAAVRILDQQWTDDGALCLVMELLDGTDFEKLLHNIESRGHHLPLGALFEIIEPVVQTLEMAHAQGILHRDLKPANIFVIKPERGGGVRLLDFGFAKFTRMHGLTAEGFVAGSPSYIAPEAWKGSPRALDQRIDVYSLAAVIFRALAGRPPFVSKDVVEILQMTTQAPRPSLHAIRQDLPASVDHWVEQALAIDPLHRFVRVTGMWAALRGMLTQR